MRPAAKRHPKVEIKDNMTRRDIRAMVWNLAWPSITEMFLVSLVSIADMIMVGRLGPVAGPIGISAVGLSNQPVFFAMALFQSFNVGTTALVARFIGAGKQEDANETAKQSMVIVFLLGIIVGTLGFLSAGSIIRFMGAGPEVLPIGTIYMQIVSIGMIFNIVAMGLSAVLRGAGDTRTPMRINMTANIVNVIGNYLLIYGRFGFPQLGVAGAGLATSLARLVAAVWIVSTVMRGKTVIRISFKEGYRYNREIVRRVLQIGLPSSGEQFILRGGQVFFVRIVAGLGTITYAAHQIAMNIMSLSFMPGMGFGIAASTLVGMSLGAERPDIAERSGYETRFLGMIMATTMGVVFIFLGPWIIRLYNTNPDVIAQGSIALRIVGLIQPAQSTQFILAGGLRGAGDTRWPLYTSAIGIWGFRVLLALFFVGNLGLGLAGAWAAVGVDQIVRSGLILYRYRSGHWKDARV